eukprot:TRINITY_DN23163_c0_g1_i1.p1 TRINITY_DN23163_c0_g1~~TRINITY_DN23163_c0_g1_i1.p1  ORF type:complete len:197 (+),score=74.60 TRINITY_DN23163_c0_g1_i1:63-593(+)
MAAEQQMFRVPRFPGRAVMAAVPAEPVIAAPFFPSSHDSVGRMLELACVGPSDVVLDIGFGDARLCFASAKAGAKAVGWEIDLGLLEAAREMAAEQAAACEFVYCDCMQPEFEDRLAEAAPTVIFCFLLQPAVDHLSPALRRAVDGGARLVTNRFHPNWEDLPPSASDGEIRVHSK